MLQLVFQILLTLVAIFLILLVLVQRGRGGGLAGALGGMGGSSAFGAKAGDVFTRITVVAAAVWIILCIAAAKLGPATAGSRLNLGTTSTTAGPDLTAPATGETPASDTSSVPASGEPASEGGENATAPAASGGATESESPSAPA